MLEGLADAKLWPMLVRWSLLESSPGEGMEGSFRLRFMATIDLLGSSAPRLTIGELRLLRDDRRERSAALIAAAAAREVEEERGEGVSRRGGMAMVRGCIDEADMGLEGGRELRSGGIVG